MSTINPTNISDGDAVTAASVNNQINTITNDYNGNITDANVSATASIAPTKLAGGVANMFAAWTSYTPTLTNLSGGAITYAKYIQIGKTVHYRFKYTLAGANVSGAVSLTLPVTAASDYTIEAPVGEVIFLDSGINTYPGVAQISTTTAIRIRPQNAASTYLLASADTSSTVPFTFGSGDIIFIQGTYEAA